MADAVGGPGVVGQSIRAMPLTRVLPGRAVAARRQANHAATLQALRTVRSSLHSAVLVTNEIYPRPCRCRDWGGP